MQIQTNELTDLALDWAVAECNGDEPYLYRINAYEPPIYTIKCKNNIFTPAYHTDWSQAGPIIERHCINLFRFDPKTEGDDRFWLAHIDGIYCCYGVSALTAAMRCYVASKLGDTVDIPEELVK